MSTLIEQLNTLLAPEIENLGCELWGIEYFPGQNALLRIYIDNPAGVQVEDCERVSHQVGGVLEVEELIPTAYTLEVSSPGMDRLIFNREQLARYQGHLLQIQLTELTEGRRKCQARLLSISEEQDTCELDHEGEILTIPLAKLAKIRVVPEF